MGQHDPSVFDGTNRATVDYPAVYDGHRSVRLSVEGREIGLVTATYSYGLSHPERSEVARRVAALWNLHVGTSTDDLERAVAEKWKV